MASLTALRNDLLYRTSFQTRDKSLTSAQISALYNELIQVQMDLIEAKSIEGSVKVRRVKYGD